MADEEKKDTEQPEEPQADAAEEQAPETEAEPPAEEAGAKAPAEEAEEAPAEEAEEAPAEGAPAAEAADDDETDWKTRRRLERSRRPSEPHPQRSPEERHAERAEQRRAAAAGRGRHRHSRRRRKTGGGAGTPPAEHRANPTKVRQGVVVSDKADKTITVRIDITRRHPAYEKIVRQSRTLRAHDETNEAGQGDVVRVVETRPLSRSKRWRLLEVLEKAR
jgi:small subunit ribosomal protein S17